MREDNDRAEEARAVLLDIADGGAEHDFDAMAELLARRGERLL